jgi:hypothetical protein
MIFAPARLETQDTAETLLLSLRHFVGHETRHFVPRLVLLPADDQCRRLLLFTGRGASVATGGQAAPPMAGQFAAAQAGGRATAAGRQTGLYAATVALLPWVNPAVTAKS